MTDETTIDDEAQKLRDTKLAVSRSGGPETCTECGLVIPWGVPFITGIPGSGPDDKLCLTCLGAYRSAARFFRKKVMTRA